MVHVPTFFSELATLEKKGLPNVRERIFVSDRCHIVFDCHVAADGLEEHVLDATGNSIGTTRRGIGPTYAAQASRAGVTVAEMFDEAVFERRLRNLAAGYAKRFSGGLWESTKYNVEEEIERFKGYREQLRTYVVDAVAIMSQAQDDDQNMLIEGANAIMWVGALQGRPRCCFSESFRANPRHYIAIGLISVR